MFSCIQNMVVGVAYQVEADGYQIITQLGWRVEQGVRGQTQFLAAQGCFLVNQFEIVICQIRYNLFISKRKIIGAVAPCFGLPINGTVD